MGEEFAKYVQNSFRSLRILKIDPCDRLVEEIIDRANFLIQSAMPVSGHMGRNFNLLFLGV